MAYDEQIVLSDLSLIYAGAINALKGENECTHSIRKMN